MMGIVVDTSDRVVDLEWGKREIIKGVMVDIRYRAMTPALEPQSSVISSAGYYRSNCRMPCGAWLAWLIIAWAACVRI